ncbi:MAG: formylglycine-generating enzyme family protein [Candidatus Glassbacteria bacterium]|nr:formylglycine-generating enzyme family protein [Candidatus Glassbacteria bacterium]
MKLNGMTKYAPWLLLALLIAGPTSPLPAGSRLGKVTGIMGEVVAINLGSLHGVRQGLRGRVFKFDEEKQTVNVARIQVIGVEDESCLARITQQLTDSVRVGQFVDIDGTVSPRSLQRVDVVAELEEAARNYFAAKHYTEPDSANCLNVCNELLQRDPGNRLAQELKRQMGRNYDAWAEQESYNGYFTYALIYYARIRKIDPSQERIYPLIWDIIDLIDVESEVVLVDIEPGRPPDYYYSIGYQYYQNGQFDKAIRYYQWILDRHMYNDLAATEGIELCRDMQRLLADLRRIRRQRAALEAEQQRQIDQESLQARKRLEQARYYITVAEEKYRQRDWTGALVYYLKLLDIFPDDSIAMQRRENISKADMVMIPAGEFSRGSSEREIGEVKVDFSSNNMLNRELPKNWVYLDSFLIDRYEVTNRQYRDFVAGTDHSPPLMWQNGTYPEGKGDHPVVYVSWLDAKAYAGWIGKRLPTEREWEKAARGANGFQWPWGDQFYPHRANAKESGKGTTMPVGSYVNGTNEYGVMDLAGNVWEWVEDRLEPYESYDYELLYFPRGYYKIQRGGSFKTTGDYTRGAFRGAGELDQLYSDVGFRCTREVVIRTESPEAE